MPAPQKPAGVGTTASNCVRTKTARRDRHIEAVDQSSEEDSEEEEEEDVVEECLSVKDPIPEVKMVNISTATFICVSGGPDLSLGGIAGCTNSPGARLRSTSPISRTTDYTDSLRGTTRTPSSAG